MEGFGTGEGGARTAVRPSSCQSVVSGALVLWAWWEESRYMFVRLTSVFVAGSPGGWWITGLCGASRRACTASNLFVCIVLAAAHCLLTLALPGRPTLGWLASQQSSVRDSGPLRPPAARLDLGYAGVAGPFCPNTYSRFFRSQTGEIFNGSPCDLLVGWHSLARFFWLVDANIHVENLFFNLLRLSSGQRGPARRPHVWPTDPM